MQFDLDFYHLLVLIDSFGLYAFSPLRRGNNQEKTPHLLSCHLEVWGEAQLHGVMSDIYLLLVLAGPIHLT
jgi:hypothetical protein